MLKKLLELLGLPGDTTEEKALEAMSARLKLPAASEVMTALSLNPAASVQAVMSAITTLKAAPANVIACTEVMSELGLAATVGKSEIIATIRALKQAKDHGISNAEFEAMKAEIANSKATKLVEEAMSAGKITAAQKDWAQNYAKTDPGGFKLFCEKAPVVVSMKAVEDKKVVKDPMADLTSTDREMMKMFGLTEEDFKKHYKPVVI
jgi:phage I-like protein